MKNSQILPSLLIAALLFEMTNCQPIEPINPAPKTPDRARLSAEDPYGYTATNLLKIGKGILLTASENKEFKSLMYSEIEKKFDGDYNVLTKTISEKSSTFNVELDKKILQANEQVIDDEPLNAFSKIDGKSYNPQVFIPFYEELKRGEKIGIESPVLVVFNGKRKEKDLEEGYVFNKGKISKTSFLVDEQYAKTHEVWVVSINDRTGGDLNAKTKINQPPVNSTGAVVYDPNVALGPYDYGYITGVGVSLNKESWAGGANDVYFECIYTGGPISANMPDNATKYVGDWSTNQLGEFREVDYGLREIINDFNSKWFGVYTYDYRNFPIRLDLHSHYAFVLYEQDNWPVGVNIAYITVNGYTSEIGYRSAESSYMQDYIDARSNLFLTNSINWFDKNNGAARVKTGIKTFIR